MKIANPTNAIAESQEKKMTLIPKGEGVRVFASNLGLEEKIDMLKQALRMYENLS